MNKKLIRKMLTAAGGPLRIKFDPERIARLEYLMTRVPGTDVNSNKTVGESAKKAGISAIRRKQQLLPKRFNLGEMHTMVPDKTHQDPITKEIVVDSYEDIGPNGSGAMSGTDPVGEFMLAGIGLGGVGTLAKTGAWGTAKFFPTSYFGNLARLYFVGNAFKNSFKEAVPTLTSQATSLLYLPVKLNEFGLTSLKFFERPSLSNAQLLEGATKWERNFKPKWHVANYPGYLLKGLMKGSLLEKQLSKNGTININLLNAYFNKASQLEREIANKVLAEKFAGLKTIDYNLFKKAVLDELIGKYNRVPLTEWADYGMESLGFETQISHDGNTMAYNEITGEFEQVAPFTPFKPNYQLNTFTFESPRLPLGNSKHYNASTLGHSRTYTTPEEPRVLHVMESQSDWGLAKLGNNSAPYTGTSKYLNDPESYRKFIDGHKRLLAEMKANPSDYLAGAIERQTANIKHHEAILKLMLEQGEQNPLVRHLHDNYLQRQLQENLRYAAENGLTKMRYPTSETAAKIEGYLKEPWAIDELGNPINPNDFWNFERSAQNPEAPLETLFDFPKGRGGFGYTPQHQTILKKYADFPKLFLKLFKDLKVKTITDAKGNSWYEVDVPKGYLSREWLFKQGGKMNIIKLFKEGGQIRKMQTAAGGPIKKFRTRDINGNWVYMDMKTGKTTSANPESGTIRNNAVNSVGGDNKTKRGRTQIAKNQVTSYNNRLYKVHNYADTTMRLKQKNQDVILDKQGEPEVIQADYTPTLEAPMEIVSPEFDLLTLGRQAATSMYKAAKPVTKPTVNSFADAAPTTLKLSETLSLEQIEQAYNQAKQWHLNRINSQGYRNRALRAGFTEEEIPQLLKQLTDLINRILLRKPEEVFPNIVRNSNYNGPARAEWWRTVNKKGDLVQGIGYYNTYGSYDDAVSSFVHELGHGMTYGLNGNETSGYMKMLADQFPLINRAVKYNKSLYPEITNSRIQLILPGTKMGKYFSEPTEMLSRGYEFMRDYTNNKFRFNLAGKTNPTLFELTGRRDNSRIFRGLASDDGATNFYKNALSIGTPTGIAGTYLYNNLDSKEVEYLKQGGKMNILEFLKNGSGIHIKEKNKGKFTSYCGGKVTDECIRKAKASGNPTLVKRATFAANARKWKHKNGGIVVKAADGTKTTNFFLKVGNFLNSDLGKTVGTGLVNAFSSWTSSNKLNNAIDSLIEGLKKQNKADINSIQDWALQKATEEITLKFNELLLLFNSGASFEQPSPVFFEHLELQLANKYAQKAINDANLNSQEAIANLESLKTNPTSDVFSSLVNTGFDYLSNKFANKALDKNGVPSSRNTNASFYSNPYLKTQNKVGTINFDGSMNTGIGGTTYNWKTNTFGSNNSLFKF